MQLHQQQIDFKKVESYFESSQNISILNEFCQVEREPQPEYKLLTSEGYNPVQLHCLGQVFVCYRSTSKNIGKKACAQAAVEYFTSTGKMKLDRQYVPLLFQLCTFAHLEPPVFSMKSIEKGMVHVCHVMDTDFVSNPNLTKTQGRNQTAKEAFKVICRLERVAHSCLAAISQIPPAIRVESGGGIQSLTAEQVGIKRPLDQPPNPRPSGLLVNKEPQSTAIATKEDGELEEGEAMEEVYEDYESKLRALYESDPLLGKPFLNFRTVLDRDGIEKCRAQLIMGSRVRMSKLEKSQADAKEIVCKLVYEDIKASAEDYCSDKEAGDSIPTYLQMLQKLIAQDVEGDNRDTNRLEFQYTQGTSQNTYTR